MKRRALYVALGLLIAVNAVVLLGVARNRSGVPDAVVTLTERELPLSWSFRHEENTGVSLHLNVNSDSEEQKWFDEAKLAELGFDTRLYRESDRSRVYRELPRKAYLVFEYDGEAWQRHRQRQLEEIEDLAVKVREGKLEPEDAENQKKEMLFRLSIASHLFSVDAGSDPGVLRQRYADRSRYLILPARVRMMVDWRCHSEEEKDEERLCGLVQQILVDELHVPRRLHRELLALPEKSRIHPGYTPFDPKDPARVRYRAQVAVGRRLEPWVKGIEIGDE
jgi:hypothetical protein